MLIKMNDLTKSYRTDEVETTALNNINIGIEQGEFVAIMGPSGCGKSTLLNIIGMLDSPTSGEYVFNGENVAGYPESRLGKIRKHNIGFIFQSFNLIDELTVFENIELALLYHKIPSKDRREAVNKVMDKVGIGHRAKHMPSQLSGGQQQRVAVARAVVADPALILADEPTGNLDPNTKEGVLRVLLDRAEAEGSTVLAVTHDHALLPSFDRVVDFADFRTSAAA